MGARKRKSNMKKWALTKKPNLSELISGQHCIVQDPNTKKWDKKGRIVSPRNRRSYTVLLRSGKEYIRNRKYIRPDNARQKEAEEVEVQERNAEERNMENQQRKPLRRSKRIMNNEQTNCGSEVKLKKKKK